MLNEFIHIYGGTVTQGRRDGTKISADGSFSSPIRATVKGDSLIFRLAIRVEDGYKSAGTTTIKAQRYQISDTQPTSGEFRTIGDKYYVPIEDNGVLQLSLTGEPNSFSSSIQISDVIRNENHIFYAQALNLGRGVDTAGEDTKTRIELSGAIVEDNEDIEDYGLTPTLKFDDWSREEQSRDVEIHFTYNGDGNLYINAFNDNSNNSAHPRGFLQVDLAKGSSSNEFVATIFDAYHNNNVSPTICKIHATEGVRYNAKTLTLIIYAAPVNLENRCGVVATDTPVSFLTIGELHYDEEWQAYVADVHCKSDGFLYATGGFINNRTLFVAHDYAKWGIVYVDKTDNYPAAAIEFDILNANSTSDTGDDTSGDDTAYMPPVTGDDTGGDTDDTSDDTAGDDTAVQTASKLPRNLAIGEFYFDEDIGEYVAPVTYNGDGNLQCESGSFYENKYFKDTNVDSDVIYIRETDRYLADAIVVTLQSSNKLHRNLAIGEFYYGTDWQNIFRCYADVTYVSDSSESDGWLYCEGGYIDQNNKFTAAVRKESAVIYCVETDRYLADAIAFTIPPYSQ